MKKSSNSVSPIMRKLSSYIAQALRRPLPAAVTERPKYHLLDTVWNLERVEDVCRLRPLLIAR